MTPAGRLAQALFMEANELIAAFGGVADEVGRNDVEAWAGHLRDRAEQTDSDDRTAVAA